MIERHNKKYFTVKEIADELQISRQAAYKKIDKLKEQVEVSKFTTVEKGITYYSSDILDRFKNERVINQQLKKEATDNRYHSELKQLKADKIQLLEDENARLKAEIEYFKKQLETVNHTTDTLTTIIQEKEDTIKLLEHKLTEKEEQNAMDPEHEVVNVDASNNSENTDTVTPGAKVEDNASVKTDVKLEKKKGFFTTRLEKVKGIFNR